MTSSWKIGMLAVVTGAGMAAYFTPPKTVEAAAFTLTSAAFKNNAAIPEKYSFNAMGCTGANTSPALEWKNRAAGTKSFALMAHDPDAPTGSGWWHWVVYNIPAGRDVAARGRRRCRQHDASQGRPAGEHGLWQARLGRSLSLLPGAASTTTTSRCSR